MQNDLRGTAPARAVGPAIRADASAAVPGAPRAGLSAASIMLLFLAMSYMLSYFDRMLMVVLGEMIKKEFSLSDKALSLLTGASFVVIYGVVGLAAGWMVDRYSRKRILAWALVLWSATTMACGLAHSFLQLALARACVGVGEAANVPAALSIISDAYPTARRPMAIALFYAGGMVGILGSFMLGTWLASHYGWRVAFFAAGVPGIVLALLLIFFAREPVRERPAAADPGSGGSHRSFQLVRRNRPLVWLLAAGAIGTFTNVGLMQWLPMFFIRSHQMSMANIGLYFGPALAGGMIAGMLLGGVLGNYAATKSVGGMVRICAWSLVALVPLYLVLLWVPSLPVALGLTFVATALSVVYTPCFTAAYQTVCDPRARGTAAGISGFCAMVLGGAVCPFAVGVLSDFLMPAYGVESLRYALMVSMVFCVIAGVLYYVSARLIDRIPTR